MVLEVVAWYPTNRFTTNIHSLYIHQKATLEIHPLDKAQELSFADACVTGMRLLLMPYAVAQDSNHPTP